MSEQVKCVVCKKIGKRRRGRMSPDHWLFGEDDSSLEDNSSLGILVVWACSEKCAFDFWRKGPGKIDLSDPKVAFKRDLSALPGFSDDYYK